MSAQAWRAVAIALAVACALLWLRGRGPRDKSSKRASAGHASGKDSATSPSPAGRDPRERNAWGADAGAVEGSSVELPEDLSSAAWPVAFLVPHDGETAIEYRDRVLPVVQTAVAPHRRRVARLRDEFFDAARLDEEQREELHAAVNDAADAIKNRILEGIATREILPPYIRPAAVVAFVRDILDLADRAYQRFRSKLTDEQLAMLADSNFDVADYLLFSVTWEDLLELLD
jgi:hypothetical protein